MAVPSRVKTWANGNVLTHTDLNAEFDNIIDNGLKPTGIDDHSGNATAMKVQTNPGTGDVPILPVDLSDELEMLRFQINQIQGTSHWFQDPSTSIIGGGGWIDGDMVDISFGPTNYTPTCDGTSNYVTGTSQLSAHLAGIDAFLGSEFNVGAMEDGSVMLPFEHHLADRTESGTEGSAVSTSSVIIVTSGASTGCEVAKGRVYIPASAELISMSVEWHSTAIVGDGEYARFYVGSTATVSSKVWLASSDKAWSSTSLDVSALSGWNDIVLQMGDTGGTTHSIYVSGFAFAFINA